MLKIREDVDLKELEEYGYEIMKDWLDRLMYYKHVAPYTSIEIDIETRVINEQREDILRCVDEEYIQDLIQANLVVEVEEK